VLSGKYFFRHLLTFRNQKELMKKIFLLLSLCIAFTGFSQRASPHDTVSNKNGDITVTYGRPYKNGRDIFGGLEPFGKVWRLGADEATNITFKKDVKFDGQTVPAGTYTLFALLNEKEWTFILNSQLGQWGAFSYEKNKSKDVVSATRAVGKLDKTVEQLTIWFQEDNTMVVDWDQTEVKLPLSF
jgi:hypothetical protein